MSALRLTSAAVTIVFFGIADALLGITCHLLVWSQDTEARQRLLNHDPSEPSSLDLKTQWLALACAISGILSSGVSFHLLMNEWSHKKKTAMAVVPSFASLVLGSVCASLEFHFSMSRGSSFGDTPGQYSCSHQRTAQTDERSMHAICRQDTASRYLLLAYVVFALLSTILPLVRLTQLSSHGKQSDSQPSEVVRTKAYHSIYPWPASGPPGPPGMRAGDDEPPSFTADVPPPSYSSDVFPRVHVHYAARRPVQGGQCGCARCHAV